MRFELTFEVIDAENETNWEATFSGTVAIKDAWLSDEVWIPHGTITELAGGSGGTIVLKIESAVLNVDSLEIYINSSGSQKRGGYVVSASAATVTQNGSTQQIAGFKEGLKVDVSWAPPSAE